MADNRGGGDRVLVGAEARLTIGKTVKKERVKKSYRHEKIDAELRTRRTRSEAKILQDAARAGVNVPKVLRVGKTELELERIDGRRLKEMETLPEELCKKIGEQLGKLHSARIAHMDLTTSNMILGDNLYFIDFGLSRYGDLEDFGVDLHLLRRALIAAHKNAEKSFAAVLEGYEKTFKNAKKAIEREKVIDTRGRYT